VQFFTNPASFASADEAPYVVGRKKKKEKRKKRGSRKE
jgi:hypothetical protein